jgi:serine/threonine protein kinase
LNKTPLKRTIIKKQHLTEGSALATEAVPKKVKQKSHQISDFQIIKTLGKGSFGTVFLTQKINNDLQYALKSI